MAAFFTINWLDRDEYIVLDQQGNAIAHKYGSRLSAMQYVAQLEGWYWRNNRERHMQDGLGQACPAGDEPMPK